MVWILELRDPGSSDEQKEGDFTSSLELLTRFSEFSRRKSPKSSKLNLFFLFPRCVNLVDWRHKFIQRLDKLRFKIIWFTTTKVVWSPTIKHKNNHKFPKFYCFIDVKLTKLVKPIRPLFFKVLDIQILNFFIKVIKLLV